ncbi:Zn-dependent hydrolase [Rhodobacteraceae bacterium RKSG542]|nr:Zn-dependent hydrolase [Pseudovibrio flavus]
MTLDGLAIKALGERASSLIEGLNAFSSQEDGLTRLYLSKEHKEACAYVCAAMETVGLTASIDALGTVHGLLKASEGNPSKRVLIGSHIDTVRNGGSYDGNLGVVVGILALEEIRKRGIKLPFDVEVLAFGDEEGVRFPTTLLSASAIAGVLDPSEFDLSDADGISVRDALKALGGDADSASALAYSRDETLAYLEVHIEQGPVLESKDLPLGVVTAIAGARRFSFTYKGVAGHAGTVPMGLRKDAAVSAAQLICEIDKVAKAEEQFSLVATVGDVRIKPGAVNVIADEAMLSLDVRCEDDECRQQAEAAIVAAANRIASENNTPVEIIDYTAIDTVHCSKRLQTLAGEVLQDMGLPDFRLMSGAGHDGQVMAQLCDLGMLFVRCKGGISHNPLEHCSTEDMGYAVEALVRWLEKLGSHHSSES